MSLTEPRQRIIPGWGGRTGEMPSPIGTAAQGLLSNDVSPSRPLSQILAAEGSSPSPPPPPESSHLPLQT